MKRNVTAAKLYQWNGCCFMGIVLFAAKYTGEKMKKITLQRKGKLFVPFSQEDLEAGMSFKENEPIVCKMAGTRKPRSYLQIKWLHVVFRLVAENTEDPEWDTPEKVKRCVKMAMRLYEDCFAVDSKVWFELKSFAFDKMEHDEANLRFNEAVLICAKKIGVDPETLKAEAKKESATT